MDQRTGYDINPGKIDALTQHLVLATQGPVEQAIRDADISANAISKVLMVGGSSRIPAVNALVKKMTGKEPFKGINPDECVAMGAAIQSGVLSGTVKGLLLLDVTPLSLGIETVGDNFAKVIDRNTTIPITKSRVFSTAAPYSVRLKYMYCRGSGRGLRAIRPSADFLLTVSVLLRRVYLKLRLRLILMPMALFMFLRGIWIPAGCRISPLPLRVI